MSPREMLPNHERHAMRAGVCLALTDAENALVRQAINWYAGELATDGYRNSYWESLYEIAADLTAYETVEWDSGLTCAGPVYVTQHSGHDLLKIVESLEEYALRNGANEYESFGDRPTAVADAMWQLATDINTIYERMRDSRE